MKTARIRIWSLALSTLFLQSVTGAAAADAQVYLNGHWANAKLPPSPPLMTADQIGLLSAPRDFRALVQDFLHANENIFGLARESSFVAQMVQRGGPLETHRLQKSWRGLEVLGGDVLVHVSRGQIVFASADATPMAPVGPRPRLRAEEARQIAFSSYGGPASRAEAPRLKVLILGAGAGKEARLVYSVKVVDLDQISSDVHFIDALNGEEVLVTSNVQTAVDRRVMAGLGSQEDFGVVSDPNADQLISQRFTAVFADRGCPSSAASGTAPDAPCQSLDPSVMASAQAAWKNSGLVYDYYLNDHQRDSVDGHGRQILSVVNFGGPSFKNAAWYNDRKIMLYGMGDETRYNDFASPLDIVGHEITHGVTASTAALQYASEAGALNESYSDVFGKLMAFRNGAPEEWKIGRGLFRDGVTFIRDMEHPEIGHTKDFKFRNELCNRANDNCGVHENSGIPSKAAVAIAGKLGAEKLGKIYFLTLTQLLRTNSDFKEARAQTEAACGMLYGKNSGDCQVVSEAFAAVGI